MSSTLTPYHILNGDALLERFPTELSGEQIVMRECLVDGPIEGETPAEFYKNRAEFIDTFEGFKAADYYNGSVSEIEKMLALPEDAIIYLWFEDDLFCQVNFWFILHILKDKTNPMYLVRSKKHARYGFGDLQVKRLIDELVHTNE